MTLNKQRILNELGSVVNQLQSADCGCMGRLFGNAPQNMNCVGNSSPQQAGCGYGYHTTPHITPCQGHGCHTHSPCCGPTYSMNALKPPQRPYTCMGQCNAPKLYADTYNYLNENLMQPIVKEVYNDLNSITPANTIMNNELGNKLGLMQQGFGLDKALNKNLNSFNPQMQPMGQNTQSSAMAHNQQYLGGMGPQIVNMLNGESTNKPMQPQQGLNGPIIIDAPQSPHGKVGLTPLTAPVNTNNNQQSNENRMSNFNEHQIYSASVPNLQQTQPAIQQPSYGQHTQGMKKFNDIFPGVMQGLGGDLGFDPMAIAIQMNPANQQQVAMNTMQKMMNNNQNISKILEPSVNSVTPQQSNANTIQNMQPNQTLALPQNGVSTLNNVPINPNLNNNNQPIIDQQQPNTAIPAQNQQIYYTPTSQGMIQQNTPQPQAQKLINPNAGVRELPSIEENNLTNRANTLSSRPQTPHNIQRNMPQPVIKEPIFPVDTTKQKIYHHLNNKKYSEPAYFNTLGQPVEKFPANMYRYAIPSLPQTLSPQPNDNGKYSKVKPTISKTALMGEKPTERTPSRSQLQQIYKQYKGSQSYTKQNIIEPVEGSTHSERHFKVKQETRQQNAIPVEKVGGDAAIGGQFNKQQWNNIEPVTYDHIGDVPVPNKPGGDLDKPEKILANNNRKGRNGLQDMVYTSYPTSAAWTFHGDGQPGNHYPSHRGRRYNRY